MKLHLSQSTGENRFSAYGAGYVAVNGVRYGRSVVVTPRSVTDWNVTAFEQLGAPDFEFVSRPGIEIVLLGTGAVQRFPGAELMRAIAAAGVGLEVMDTRAACRTYNILAAEGRRVAAAILIE